MLIRNAFMPFVVSITAIFCMQPVQLAVAASSTYEAQVLSDSPFLYYRLGDASGTVATDSSGNNHHGVYENAPTLGVPGLGSPGDTAVTLSGGSQHALAPASTATFGSMMANSSFEAVFRTTTTGVQYLMGTANTGSNTFVGLGLNENGAQQTRLLLRADGGVNIGGWFNDASVFDGNYHHVLFTYDSTGVAQTDRLKAYLDGVEKGLTFVSTGTPTNFTNFGFPFEVGGLNNRGVFNRELNGTIDEAAIYASTLTATDAADRAAALGVVIPNQWNIDGGGSFNVASNWKDNVVPTLNALLGAANVTANATITLDSPATLNRVSLQNAARQYTLAGPSALTLTGDREIATSGTQRITADILGTSGMVKTGTGTLNLSEAKSYTGATDVQGGTLLLHNLEAIDNQASGVLNVGAAGNVNLGVSGAGTIAAQLIGTGTVRLLAELTPADTVTISRSNASFNGLMRLENGTLQVTNNDALGSGGLTVDRTALDSTTGTSTAKIALSGGVTIANEFLDVDGRSNESPSITSSGSNTWNGVIQGQAGSANFPLINIESTSGTLSLNRLFAGDNAITNRFVFSGAGNTTITGQLSDANINVDTGVVSVKGFDNVEVVKRGSGTLTIGYATTSENDYWFGPTTIEQGSMVVNSSGGTDGELRSSAINIRSGATFNISAFTEYTQQVGQAIRGSGTIAVGAGHNLRLIDVSSVSPGDQTGAVGTLTVQSGNVSLPDLGLGGGGAWNFDVGNSTNTTGDRLNVAAGSFTGTSAGITVNVTPAHGHLDAGNRTIISHTGGANSAMNGVVAQITDANGNPLNTRQSVAINGDTAGQVNVVVTGEEASRTWNGNASSAWDVATTNNWQEGDQQYKDLDRVTFNDLAAGTTNVSVDGARHAGSVTFANSSKQYTLSGNGGITGSGSVSVNGTGQVTLANTGNNYSGSTTVAAGGNLRMTSANTGSVSISNSGTFSLGVPVEVTALVQNGTQTIGAGNRRVFAIEAENFQSNTVNNAGVVSWDALVEETASDGEAIAATPGGTQNLSTVLADQNYVTYGIKFTQPGTYFFYSRIKTIGATAANDSIWLPAANFADGVTDPPVLSTRMDLGAASSAVNAEGIAPNAVGNPGSGSDYDWYRGAGQGGGFNQIIVSEDAVNVGTVFQFKVATRENGTALDKFVFVQNPDFVTDPAFGTITDLDLDGAPVITNTSVETVTTPGTVLNVNGNFTMNGNNSVLNVLIGAPTAHDQIHVQGNLAADGILNIGTGSVSLAAQAGDIFDIFTFGSVSGAFDDINLPTLAPGLAWDTSNLLVTGELMVESLSLPGDYNGNGVVDAADYTVWRDNLGTTNLLPNDPIGGMITSAQYDQWKSNFGTSFGSGSGSSVGQAAVPEPTSLVVALFAVTMCMGVRNRFCR